MDSPNLEGSGDGPSVNKPHEPDSSDIVGQVEHKMYNLENIEPVSEGITPNMSRKDNEDSKDFIEQFIDENGRVWPRERYRTICFAPMIERISAYAAGRFVLADIDHFLYVKRKSCAQVTYLSCRESTCTGSFKWQSGGNAIVSNRRHNHEPTEKDYQELLFRQSLRHRAAAENTPLKTIYQQELQINKVGSQHTTFATMSNLMYRARQAGTPPIPNSIEHFASIIADERWSRRYGKDLGINEEDFFRAILHSDVNPIAIFVSEGVRRYVATLGVCHIHLDTTFKVMPRNGMGTQLFVVHLHAFGTVFPLLLALMQKKTEDGYLRVLQYLQGTVAMEPDVVMADYQNALRNAVVQVWPNTRLLGCWFHSARAIFQKSRQLGVQANDKQKELTKVSMVIPLLPENLIQEGITYLETEGIDGQFLDYLRREWQGQNMSVHDADQGTNNSVESFHRDLFVRVGRPHPNIWALVDILRFVEHGKVCDLQNLVAGRVLPWRKRPRYLRANRRLEKYRQLLTVESDVPQYLKRVSHLADRLVRFFEPAEALDLYGQRGDLPVMESINDLLQVVDQALLEMEQDEEMENEIENE